MQVFLCWELLGTPLRFHELPRGTGCPSCGANMFCTIKLLPHWHCRHHNLVVRPSVEVGHLPTGSYVPQGEEGTVQPQHALSMIREVDPMADGAVENWLFMHAVPWERLCNVPIRLYGLQKVHVASIPITVRHTSVEAPNKLIAHWYKSLTFI